MHNDTSGITSRLREIELDRLTAVDSALEEVIEELRSVIYAFKYLEKALDELFYEELRRTRAC